MTQDRIEFLKELVETPTPAGSESAGALLLGRRVKSMTGVKPYIDVHGNLHAVLDVGAKTTVMLEGHGDEIGYMVQYIDERGFVYFQAIGGVVVPLTAAERVTILSANGPVNGVVGSRPPHLMKGKDRSSVAADDLRALPCDIGASTKAEAEALVAVGDPAVADAGFRRLAGTRVSGRGLDDRAGTFAMAEAFIRLASSPERPRVNVHYVSSVCEEIGLVGGRLASYSVAPQIGISCDVGFAEGPHGDDVKVTGEMKLGGGAALAVGPIYHRGLVDFVRRTAREKGVPLQERAVARGSGNNGWSLKTERGGAAVVQIAIPLRYMHSPVEVIDLRDVDSVVDLVVAVVLGLDDGFNLLPEQP